MKQQPDNLFREKLEQHSLPAPEAAWDRIQKEMPAQHNTLLIYKVAAAVSVLLVSLALLIPKQNNTQTLLSFKETSPAEKTRVTPKNSLRDSSAQGIIKKKEDVTKKKSSPKPTQKKSAPAILNYTKPAAEVAHIVVEQELQESGVNETNAITDLIEKNAQDVSKTVAVAEESSSTIVLASEEVNRKYLIVNLTDDATPRTNTASSFRKLLDKAADLKNNATGLGELRQKKNELLALNPDRNRDRNEKRERNN